MFVEECSYEPVPAFEPRERRKVPGTARSRQGARARKTQIERAGRGGAGPGRRWGLPAGLAVELPGCGATWLVPAFCGGFFKIGLKE